MDRLIERPRAAPAMQRFCSYWLLVMKNKGSEQIDAEQRTGIEHCTSIEHEETACIGMTATQMYDKCVMYMGHSSWEKE